MPADQAPIEPASPPTQRQAPTKTLCVLQSNYIPWKGYFDLIKAADECILLDDVQYTKNDWRNRNRIKTRIGPAWLTIPVAVSGRFGQRIRDATVTSSTWAIKHWTALTHSYHRTPYFSDLSPAIKAAYEAAADLEHLSAINELFIHTACELLGISTRITRSCDYELAADRNARLIGLCQQVGATRYLSGPSARAYIDQAAFDRANITLSYIDYREYREYDQPFPPFEHAVSIVDLIFCTGNNAQSFMKSVSSGSLSRHNAL